MQPARRLNHDESKRRCATITLVLDLGELGLLQFDSDRYKYRRISCRLGGQGKMP